MARRPRLHVPGGCYHVTLRGNHREALFESAADRAKLNAVIAGAIERFDARVHAFCWMTNHLHALVQIGEHPLGNFIQHVAWRYSRYRHKSLNTTGHLFERRHGARLIDVDNYFLAVLRYVHLNPVKAGITADPGGYPWSSHCAYLGTRSIDWITTELGLSLLSADSQRARRIYARFIGRRQRCDEADLDDRVHPDDRRVLGDDAFVERVNGRSSRPRKRISLDELCSRICSEHGIPVELLRSRSSRRSLTPIRLELLEQALTARIANLTEVASYLGRDPSTLCKLRARWTRIIGKSKKPMPGTD